MTPLRTRRPTPDQPNVTNLMTEYSSVALKLQLGQQEDAFLTEMSISDIKIIFAQSQLNPRQIHAPDADTDSEL